MAEPLSADEFATISREFYATLLDFRRAIAVRAVPSLQIRTWKLAVPTAQWSGGVWCAEPHCGCRRRIYRSEMKFGDAASFTLTDLHEAIAEHIAEKAERDAGASS